MRRATKRTNHTPNSGSLADIAFLLLIFFMVTTSLHREYSISMRLPPSYDGEPGKISESKVLSLCINEHNEYLIENTLYKNPQAEDLSAFIDQFIIQNIEPYISIQIHPATEYESYINILSIIKESIRQSKSSYAEKNFGKKLDKLSVAELDLLKSKYNIKISETEIETTI